MQTEVRTKARSDFSLQFLSFLSHAFSQTFTSHVIKTHRLPLSAFNNTFPQTNTRVVRIRVFYCCSKRTRDQMKPRRTSAGRPLIGPTLRKFPISRPSGSCSGPMGSKRGRGRRPWGRFGLWSYSPPMIPGSGGCRGTGTGLKMSRGVRWKGGRKWRQDSRRISKRILKDRL